MDAVEAELRALGEEPSGRVRLGAFQSAIHTLAVPAIAHLGHPACRWSSSSWNRTPACPRCSRARST
jgi:hypothetical protein